MQRDALGECAIGDWVLIPFAPHSWEGSRSPYRWLASGRDYWHFAFTEIPIIDPHEGEVGCDYVWMRFDPKGEIPPPPKGIVGFTTAAEEDSDPADWWKGTGEGEPMDRRSE